MDFSISERKDTFLRQIDIWHTKPLLFDPFFSPADSSSFRSFASFFFFFFFFFFFVFFLLKYYSVHILLLCRCRG